MATPNEIAYELWKKAGSQPFTPSPVAVTGNISGNTSRSALLALLTKRAEGEVADMLSKVMSKALPVANVVGAGKTGWDVGRALGQSPLITDPSTTYDQEWQKFITRRLEKPVVTNFPIEQSKPQGTQFIPQDTTIPQERLLPNQPEQQGTKFLPQDQLLPNLQEASQGEGKITLYHGTKQGEAISKDGFKTGWLTPDKKLASNYGKVIEVNIPKSALIDASEIGGDLSAENMAKLGKQYPDKFGVIDRSPSGNTMEDLVHPFPGRKPLSPQGDRVTVYHGTTKQFETVQPNIDYNTDVIDRWIGVHYAENPDLANKFAKGQNGRVIKDVINPSKTYTLPQKIYKNGAVESDQWAFQRDIGVKVFAKHPDWMEEYLKKQNYSQDQIKDIVSNPQKIKEWISNHGLLPYGDLGKRIAKEYNLIMKSMGYESIKYQNTSPMETEGISNKTSYVKLSPQKGSK